MSRDANGNYTLPPENPVVAGELITDVWCNTTMDDIAQALTESLDRGGRGGMLAPFRFSDGTIMQPGAAWALETGSGFSRTDVGVLNTSILGALIMSWTQNGMVVPAGKRITIIDPPVDPTDAVNLGSLGALPGDGTVGDGLGNQFTIGYRDIPRTDISWERGKCLVTTVGVTLTAVDVATGYTYTVLNASANAITIAPGAGVDLKVTGSDTSAPYALAPWSMVTLWCESATGVRVAAVLPVSSSDVIAALGFTPYDAANPAGYLNAITAAQVIAALGYNPVAPAGTFAVGTWNISISGNAATATSVPGLVRATSADLPIPDSQQYIKAAYGVGVPARRPDSTYAVWKCLVAQSGYVPGDCIVIDTQQGPAPEAQTTVSSTEWGLVWSNASGPEARSASNLGNNFTLNDSSWALVFHAVWLP